MHGKTQQDPASVVYTGCQECIAKGQDILIIDTTGRLQTKVNLMNELEIPIKYITFGEQISQMKLFDRKEYVENLLHR